MTKRFKEQLREGKKQLIFCYVCLRVKGCKNKLTGGDRRECTDCDTRYGCCAGVLIDNVNNEELLKNATSTYCNECKAKRVGNTKRR